MRGIKAASGRNPVILPSIWVRVFYLYFLFFGVFGMYMYIIYFSCHGRSLVDLPPPFPPSPSSPPPTVSRPSVSKQPPNSGPGWTGLNENNSPFFLSFCNAGIGSSWPTNHRVPFKSSVGGCCMRSIRAKKIKSATGSVVMAGDFDFGFDFDFDFPRIQIYPILTDSLISTPARCNCSPRPPL